MTIAQHVEHQYRKLQDLTPIALACDAVVSERRARIAHLKHGIATSNFRLAQMPIVLSGLEHLQQRSHRRSVGIYEELLTALVQDVIPENTFPISLELGVEKGLPALSIQLGTNDTAQNIMDDTGGSLTNVVSAGLRFVALARSPLRKFLVLDEPDCWIESHRIPRFAGILSGMSESIGVQAILISHHGDAAFVDLPDRLRLEKTPQGKIVVRSTRAPVWPDDSTPGIRWIRMQNFMSHEDTTLHLGPGINVLSGPNHIGKSACVNALRVFNYHTGADRHVRHGADHFIISMGIENGVVLECRRTLKSGRKTVYTLIPPQGAKREEPAGKTSPPDFVLQHMQIERLNDLDIQLSHQKMPVFLLNEPKTKQASLLSAGLEADHGRRMSEIYKTWCDEDRAIVRNNDREVQTLEKHIQEWDTAFNGKSLQEGLTPLLQRGLALAEESKALDRLQYCLNAVERSALLQTVLPASKAIDAPTYQPVEPMLALASRLQRAHAWSSLVLPDAVPQAPNTDGLAQVIALGKQLGALVRKSKQLNDGIAQLQNYPKAPDTPENATNMPALEKRVNEVVNKRDALVKKHRQAVAEHQGAEQERTAIIQEAGNVCPTCRQHWPHEENVCA